MPRRTYFWSPGLQQNPRSHPRKVLLATFSQDSPPLRENMQRVPATEDTTCETIRIPSVHTDAVSPVPTSRDGPPRPLPQVGLRQPLDYRRDGLPDTVRRNKSPPTRYSDRGGQVLCRKHRTPSRAPTVLITDRGTAFTSRLTQEVLRLSHTTHRKTTAYHHRRTA